MTHLTMEQLVAPFCSTILAHAGSKPFVVAGYSFAGLMAFEAARQLERQGASVGGVLLFGDRSTGKSTAVRGLAGALPLLIGGGGRRAGRAPPIPARWMPRTHSTSRRAAFPCLAGLRRADAGRRLTTQPTESSVARPGLESPSRGICLHELSMRKFP